ncbi:MAG TPA: HD-GYP domain-containing protein [Nitriliruptorales bacterium]
MRAERRRRRLLPAVAAAGLVVGVALIWWSVRTVDDHVALVSFALAGALSQFLPAHARPGLLLSLTNVVAFTAVLLGGPELAIPVAAAAVAAAAPSYPSQRVLRVAFNLGQFTLAGALAGFAYEAIAPAVAHDLLVAGQISGLTSARGLAALLVTGVTFTAVNFSLVALAVSLHSGERFRGVVRSMVPAIALQPLYLALSILAVVLIVDVHPAAVILLVVPAIVARTGLVALQREAEAYDQLVLALVKLIEVKDGYTRGHAERVALLAVEVAGELGYDFEARRTTRYAALLHDVGKIVVPLQILRKPAALEDHEYRRVMTHPEVGLDLLADIDFLADARPGILSHHERIDGRGYPHGLRGDDIPELARIITVVDAFDAMTSTRAYRRALEVDTAVGRIHSAAGTQFDARIVAAFDRVLGRLSWLPTQLGPDIDLTMVEHGVDA